jgi:hypothetical protein
MDGMNMAISYRKENSGHDDSLSKGQKFEDFVCINLAKINFVLQNISSQKFQYETGENLQGFEIKYDARCTGDDGTSATNRLSIEIAEKTRAENINFIPSGIYRSDNSWLYIQGNYKGFWIFSKNILIMLHKSGRYEEATMPTIKKFYLPINDADKYCAKKINL